jgi:hypothetical protein
MGMVPTIRQNNVLDAMLGTHSFSAPTTSINTRLDSSAPSAASSGTEITSGSGYSTGGSVTTFSSSASGQATSITVLQWNCTLSGGWSIYGIELNDASANRFFYGNWSGTLPISIPNGSSFQVAGSAITLNASAW